MITVNDNESLSKLPEITHSITTPELSVVVPAYNEEAVIEETYRRVTEVLAGLALSYEIIFIDDGSSDNTVDLLHRISQRDPLAKIISFSRNFGHQNAIMAGLQYSAGRAVISMDADLQHPPELIPALIDKWREGFDVVYTIREYKEGTGILKKMTSLAFYKFINIMAQINIKPGSADFRLLDRKVVDTLIGLKEKTNFLRGLIVWAGFKQTGLNYMAAERFSGKTKYTLRKMIVFALDGIISFSTFPLRITMFLGLTISSCSFLYMLYALYIKLFTSKTVPGWASIVVPILFFGGIQFIIIGIQGEYIGRIYEEVKGRPAFIIKNTRGFPLGGNKQETCGQKNEPH